jgi:DNA-binding NarL/FixJ family response regulator
VGLRREKKRATPELTLLDRTSRFLPPKWVSYLGEQFAAPAAMDGPTMDWIDAGPTMMNILLVDDHVLFREGIALLLQPLLDGGEILEAGNCEQAFGALQKHDGVDLVLMDLGLPGLSGLDGIAMMRERHADSPVVALSSSDDRETVLRALDAGAMGFIAKSSSSGVLKGALKLILAKGIYLPPSAFLSDRPSCSTFTETSISSETKPVAKTPSALGLTSRQADVLYLILQGKPAKVICRELGLSASTVKTHTSAVLRALNVTTRTQAVVAASKLGLNFDARLAQ